MHANRLRTAVLTALCLAGWVAVTRDLHPASLAGAAAMALVAALFAAPVFYEDSPLAGLRPRPALVALPALLLVLLWEGYRAGIELIVRMLSGRYRPGVVRLRTRLRSRLGQTLLANSINLVPGTITLWARDRRLYVHWFNVASRHSIHAGRIIKARIERLLERTVG
ncbi:MAG: Na+/H+ antiporter subunit E [Kiritimatiellae bacterium]|nr:Na+/H+ antiporter subunit E [Kiritimatiellia bacterium]